MFRWVVVTPVKDTMGSCDREIKDLSGPQLGSPFLKHLTLCRRLSI